MSVLELLFLALGLSMDAFAVAVCKGLALSAPRPRHSLTVGLWFGGFQALMPTLGYFLGSQFAEIITAIDHWLSFLLLFGIGLNMILSSKKEESADASLAFRPMLFLAAATSIDALAVGITFAFLKTDLLLSVSTIGIITFLCSAAGLWLGSVFGIRLKSKAEIFGGSVLLIIGTKILLEHLEIF